MGEATILVVALGGARLVGVLFPLWMAVGWALVACLVHARERVRAREPVGRVLHSERGSILAAFVYLVLGAGVLSAALLASFGVLATGAWAIPGMLESYLLVAALAALSLGAVALAQPPDGGACGVEGVRCGSWAHAYTEFEEWRLSGEHLRFRVGEVWRAVALPVELHGEVREQLEALAGGRESRFTR